MIKCVKISCETEHFYRYFAVTLGGQFDPEYCAHKFEANLLYKIKVISILFLYRSKI